MKKVQVLSGMFCWHELVTARSKDAAAFYKELLDGTVVSFPIPTGEYSIVQVEKEFVAGFSPAAPSHPTDVPSQWLSYVAVDDVDASAKAVEKAGGSIVTAPHDGGAGRAAIVRDRQGARHGLFKGREGATDGTNPTGHGSVGWIELLTDDVEDAADFYKSVFGWNIERKEMPKAAVHVASVGANKIATIFPKIAQSKFAHNRWVPFFEFDSIEHAAKRSRALGGEVTAEPADIPGVGRWASVVDAVGAEVHFIEWMKR